MVSPDREAERVATSHGSESEQKRERERERQVNSVEIVEARGNRSTKSCPECSK